MEVLPRGPRDASTAFLEAARGWRGLVVRAAPRDYLALRSRARALHACLSPTQHPREVSAPAPRTTRFYCTIILKGAERLFRNTGLALHDAMKNVVRGKLKIAQSFVQSLSNLQYCY